MKYEKIGLVNTTKMLHDALVSGYAVPAFNFNGMEQILAIIDAARATNSPVILQTSESAMKYMGEDMLINMVAAVVKSADIPIALNLDHGRTFEICKHAIDLGYSSVMIDASDKSFDENAEISARVAEYAHKYNVSAEAELGALCGIEDDAPSGGENHYTNPADAARFVKATGIDSLAVSIGTSHGVYKVKNAGDTLRFDILESLAKLLPEFPLVLHGASSIPQELINEINKNGGNIKRAKGFPTEQLRRAVGMNICKINIDSDGRLAFTAGIRQSLNANPENFDPRKYLSAARDKMRDVYISEIENIMKRGN